MGTEDQRRRVVTERTRDVIFLPRPLPRPPPPASPLFSCRGENFYPDNTTTPAECSTSLFSPPTSSRHLHHHISNFFMEGKFLKFRNAKYLTWHIRVHGIAHRPKKHSSRNIPEIWTWSWNLKCQHNTLLKHWILWMWASNISIENISLGQKYLCSLFISPLRRQKMFGGKASAGGDGSAVVGGEITNSSSV